MAPVVSWCIPTGSKTYPPQRFGKTDPTIRKASLWLVRVGKKEASLFQPLYTRGMWHPVPLLHGKYMGKQHIQWETFFGGGSKITADGDCSHEIKRHLLLGRKVMTNLDSILKSRDKSNVSALLTLPTKVHLVKAIVFPIVMYGCESWTRKKAEHRRIDAFELWCWRRPLRVPWTARRSNQSILKEISPGFIGRTDARAETPILWPPDVKSWLIWKDPNAGKDWRQEKCTSEDKMVGWHHWLNGHEFE